MHALRRSTTLGTLLILALAPASPATSGAHGPPTAWQEEPVVSHVDDELREAVVFRLADLVEKRCVFEDLGWEIAEHLRQQLVGGAYDSVTSPGALANLLTRDLRSVNGDLHLGARPVRATDQRSEDEDPAVARRAWEARARAGNYGFRRVEVLDGNVGYLELTGFLPAELGGETAVAAMAFLANCDALVIDLRQNGGGNPSMIQLLCSYFFEQATHLNSFENRGEELRQQFWTLPHVPGKKLVDTPLFVLTSASTFSAAEEFSYDLRNLERATLVGETTGGGAHPGDTHPVEGVFSVFIPDGRAINPISGTNWEGVGVEPHVAVPAAEALERALQLAREAIRARAAEDVQED